MRARAQAGSSAAAKKLDMTTTYDKINADLRVRFDRKPVKGTDESISWR